MKKKTIAFGVLGTYILLIAAAIYILVELLQLDFIMAFLTVTSAFSAIMGMITFLFRNRFISGLIKLSKDKKDKLLDNYARLFKLYKNILWLSPIYALVFILAYEYVPGLQIETAINIVIIAVMLYLGVILNVMNKKFAISKLKENLLNQTEPSH